MIYTLHVLIILCNSVSFMHKWVGVYCYSSVLEGLSAASGGTTLLTDNMIWEVICSFTTA